MDDDINKEFASAIDIYKRKNPFLDMANDELADALDDYIDYIEHLPIENEFNGQEILGYLSEISKRLKRF